MNLEWYFICFQSYDNRYIIPEAPKTAEWISKMTITSPYSSDSIELINNQEECIKYNDKAGFNYNITLSSGVGFKLSSDWQSITFDNTKNLKWDVYAMPVFKHLITQYIIIFLAWWAMILLFVGIWKFLVRGI